MSYTKLTSFLILNLLSYLSIAQTDNYELELATKWKDRGDELIYTNSDSSTYYYTKAIPIFEKNEDWDNVMSILLDLSTLYNFTDQLDKLSKTGKQLNLIAEEHYTKNSKLFSVAKITSGSIHRIKGNLQKAIDDFTEAKAYKPNELNSLKNLATTYLLLGEFELSYEYGSLIESELIYPNTLNTLDDISALTSIARIFHDSKKYNNSRRVFNIAENILKGSALDAEFNEAQLSYIYYLKSKLYAELNLIDSSNLFLEKMQNFDNPLTLEKLYYLQKSQNFKSQGLFNLSKKNLKSCLKISSKENRKDFSYNNYLLSDLFFINQELDSALYYSKIALSSIQNCDKNCYYFQPPSALKVLKQNANINYKLFEGNNDQMHLHAAYKSYEETGNLIDYLHDNYLNHQSKLFLQENAVEINEGAINVCLQLFKTTEDPIYLEKALNFTEQLKAKTLLTEIRDRTALKNTGLSKKELESEKNQKLELAFLEKQINEGRMNHLDSLSLQKLKIEYIKQKNTYNDFLSKIEDDNPKFKQFKSLQKELNLKSIQSELKKDEVILEYFVGLEKSYLFKISKSNLALFELCSTEVLSQKVSKVQNYISNPPFNNQDHNSIRLELAEISNLLLHNHIPDLDNSITKLYIVPDNVISFIPFECLLDKDATNEIPKMNDYLLDDFKITYGYSIHLLRENNKSKNGKPTDGFLGFAPSFSNQMAEASRSCSNNELYSLRCSNAELEGIQKIVKGKAFSGLGAKKINFIDEAPKHNIIHLATHACIDEDNPRFNKIYFTDDYLSNAEIQNLDLNADLAILSACNTGSGKLAKGEGVLSLSRDFIYAGCHSIVTSLWAVDDCSTSEIMINFYKNINAGKQKDESLQLAKLSFLKNSDRLKSHPYYWAPFIQVGSIKPISFKNSPNWFYYLAIIPILLILALTIKGKK